MYQPYSEPENKEAPFHVNEENDDKIKYGEEEKYIGEEHDGYSSDGHSEQNDNDI